MSPWTVTVAGSKTIISFPCWLQPDFCNYKKELIYMLSRSIPLAVFMLASLLTAESWAASCLSGSCHKPLATTKYLHGPVAAELAGAKGCVTCHVPAGKACTQKKKGVFRPLASSGKMCKICHSRGTGTQHSTKKVNCLKCHDPHGSNKSARLKR